jgi:hypothetical protein
VKTRRTQRQKKNVRGVYRQPIAYRDYLRTCHWESVRNRYKGSNLEQYCIACGAERYELHHLVYDRLWCELPGDLIALCRECHERMHWFLETRKVPRDQIETILREAFLLIPETRIRRIVSRFREAQDWGKSITSQQAKRAWKSLQLGP